MSTPGAISWWSLSTDAALGGAGSLRELPPGVKQQMTWMLWGQVSSQWHGQASGGSRGRPGNFEKFGREIATSGLSALDGSASPSPQQLGLQPGAQVRHRGEH